MKFMRYFLVLVLCSPLQAFASPSDQEFITLSFHEVSDDAVSVGSRDIMYVRSDELISYFSWMREHGYQPVSMDDVIAARKGENALPDNAVLLTFDDGYRSVYTRVYPLLKLFDYPAVIALVGKWMDVPAGEMVSYGDDLLPRERFLKWDEVREMVASGLVEVASHSYDLHHGVFANPQGNSQPAAITRIYDDESKAYETDVQFQERLRNDLKKSVRQIRLNTGKAPRVMVWPYGAYNQVTVDIAATLGMPYTMTLDSGRSRLSELSSIKRVLVKSGAKLSDLAWSVKSWQAPPVRVAHVDLDYIYDADPERQEINLGILLDRIKSLQINTVYLQAYADPDGDGHADALYYPNQHLPMQADLFNRVAWQLRTRAGVSVYAWLPVLAYQFDGSHSLSGAFVRNVISDAGGNYSESYRRLSPFNAQARQVVGDIYEDLAKHANFAGLLFHDDAYLSDFEDSSVPALKVYQEEWGLPSSIEEIRSSPALLEKWAQHKTQALIDFTHELRDRVRQYHPNIKTARNIYSRVIMQPESEEWFAQSLPAFVRGYDYTAVMAMPYMEEAENPDEWLSTLVARAASQVGDLGSVVFELQSVDWRSQSPVESKTLARQMRLLQKRGVLNFGYYPDDFITGHPGLNFIHPEFSLSTYPYVER